MRLLFESSKREELIATPIFYLKWSSVIVLRQVRVRLSSETLGRRLLPSVTSDYRSLEILITGLSSDRAIRSATLSYRRSKSLISFRHVLPAFLTGSYRHSSYCHMITFLCINVSERGTSRLLVWSIALCECLYIYCLLYSWSLLILAPFYLI